MRALFASILQHLNYLPWSDPARTARSIIVKYCGFLNAPADDVVQRTGSVYANFSWHRLVMSYMQLQVTQKNNPVPLLSSFTLRPAVCKEEYLIRVTGAMILDTGYRISDPQNRVSNIQHRLLESSNA